MQTVFINQRELCAIELIRMALSEECLSLREHAIKACKHDIVGTNLGLLDEKCGPDWQKEAENTDLVSWIAETYAERHEAVHSLSEIGNRYERKNERKLNIAEQVGKTIWQSIQAGKYEGVQTSRGILGQVREVARGAKVRGGQDKDVIRKIWNTYRGVVHLGMAMDYCEDNQRPLADIFSIAERVRRTLSTSCPKGTKKPYVDRNEQISFLYISTLSGPRFRNRGLPYGIS